MSSILFSHIGTKYNYNCSTYAAITVSIMKSNDSSFSSYNCPEGTISIAFFMALVSDCFIEICEFLNIMIAYIKLTSTYAY